MRRRDYEDLMASRNRPWSWRREIRAALRRFGVVIAAITAIMFAFWLIFSVFGG